MSIMNIIMKSSKYEVVKIVNKTRAKMFKDIEVGDILSFSVPIKYAGTTSSGASNSVSIRVENESKEDNVVYKTFNQLPTILRNFELMELRGR